MPEDIEIAYAGDNVEVEIVYASDDVQVEVVQPQEAITIEINTTTGNGNGGSFNPSLFAIGVVPSGLLNGENATFEAPNDFIPESVEVFCNGSLLTKIDDYNTSGNRTITTNFSPASTEKITLNYIKL